MTTAGTPFRKTGSTTALAASLPPAEILEQALCAQVDPEVFFPEKGCSTRDAKTVCGSCPVQAACLTWALDIGESHGIWGGVSARDRAAIRRARKSAA